MDDLYNDDYVINDFDCEVSAFDLNEWNSLFENMAENLERMSAKIRKFVIDHMDGLGEVIQSFAKVISRLIDKNIKRYKTTSESCYFEKADLIASSSTEQAIINNPTNAPPFVNDYQTEKDQLKLIALRVFAALMLVVGVCLAFSYSTQLIATINLFKENLPMLFVLSASGKKFIKWILPSKYSDKLKSRIRSFLGLKND